MLFLLFVNIGTTKPEKTPGGKSASGEDRTTDKPDVGSGEEAAEEGLEDVIDTTTEKAEKEGDGDGGSGAKGEKRNMSHFHFLI